MSYFADLANFLASTIGIAVLSLIVVWGLVWKGFALYRAGKQNQPGWFVALFLINTVGVLEILYLAFFSKRRRRPHRRQG
jgi:methionyl-tRNA synthetase